MTARKLHFKLFNGGGSHRAGDTQIDLQDEIEVLKMQLDFTRKLAAGRKTTIARMGADNQYLHAKLDEAEQRLVRALAELDHLRATCRRQAADLDNPDSVTTQELRFAEAAPLVVDLARLAETGEPAKLLITPTSPVAVPQLMHGLNLVRSHRVTPHSPRKEIQ